MRITDLPEHERPREKLLKQGAAALSDAELMAVMLGSGNKKYPVLKLARKILALLDKEGTQPELAALQKLEGVGPARAMLVSAAMEFARRRIRPEGLRIRTPQDLLPLIRHYADRKQEHFLCTALNGADEVIATRVVTVGLVDETQVHPREVFAEPLIDRASGIIIAHNHPSGSVKPSRKDVAVTRRLAEAGKLLGIRLVDHVIFTHSAYFSFAEQGMMP